MIVPFELWTGSLDWVSRSCLFSKHSSAVSHIATIFLCPTIKIFLCTTVNSSSNTKIFFSIIDLKLTYNVCYLAESWTNVTIWLHHPYLRLFLQMQLNSRWWPVTIWAVLTILLSLAWRLSLEICQSDLKPHFPFWLCRHNLYPIEKDGKSSIVLNCNGLCPVSSITINAGKTTQNAARAHELSISLIS